MDKPMTWNDEDTFWRSNFRSRPYASSAGQDYDYYQPAYRYGFNASHQFKGRSWDDVEGELSRGWDSYEHRGTSTWAQIKDAVRDAWDRVTGKSYAHSH
jgi:hypothetical protein